MSSFNLLLNICYLIFIFSCWKIKQENVSCAILWREGITLLGSWKSNLPLQERRSWRAHERAKLPKTCKYPHFFLVFINVYLYNITHFFHLLQISSKSKIFTSLQLAIKKKRKNWIAALGQAERSLEKIKYVLR